MESFDKNSEGREIAALVKKFEQMIEQEGNFYFESDEICEIIDYYYQWLNVPMAVRALEYGQKLFPYDPEIRIRRVRLLCFENKTREALHILNQMEESHPDNPDIYLERGHIYSQMALLEQAVENYRKALPFYDMKEEIYYYMGSAFAQMGKWNDAAFYFKKVLKIDPDFEEAIYPFTEAMIYSGKTEECIRLLNGVIDKRPYCHSAWISLAHVYSYLEDYTKSLDCLEYADAIEPDHPEMLYLKAECFLNLEMPEKSVEILKELLKNPEPYFSLSSLHLLTGDAYAEMNQHQKALLHYNKAIQHDEGCSDAWRNIGVVLNETGRYVEARHYFMKAVELSPLEADNWFLLGQCLKNCGQAEEAIQSFLRAIEIDANEKDYWTELLLTLFQNGYEQEGEKYIMQAIKHFPDEAVFYYIFSACLFGRGKTQSSMEALHKAVALNPDEYEYLFMVNPSMMNTDMVLSIIRKS